jgi:hypothetical protein
LTRLMVFAIASMILLVQTSCQFNKRTSLEYNKEFDHMVVFAKERSSPGAPLQLPFCNELPALIIWGDGSAVRREKMGTIPEQEIQQILEFLESQEFFTDPPSQTNPAGTGIDLTVYLTSGAAQGSWNSYPQVYQQIIDRVEPYLSPFTPDSAILLAVPYPNEELDGILPAEIPNWPSERFGFSLSEVPQEGRGMDTEGAIFVWQAIQESPLVTRFQEEGQIYAVSLNIPGILEPRQSGRCW